MTTRRLFNALTCAAAITCSASALHATDTLHATFVSAAMDDEYGFSVAAIADLNADNIDDVVIGIPGDATLGPKAGAVLVVSGADGSTLLTLNGTQEGERFGHAVEGLPDISGDGIADFAVGIPFRDFIFIDAGVTKVYSGADGSELLTLSENAGVGQRLGSSVADAGDVDDDGTTDIIVGAPFTVVDAGVRRGAAYVYSGATGTQLAAYEGDNLYAFFGTAVAGLGDINSDGKSEVIVGMPGYNIGNTASNAGRITVFDGATSTALYDITGIRGDDFGRALDTIGDLDSDGINDFAVAAWARDEATLKLGAVIVYSGTDGSPISATIHGQQRAELSGTSVAGVGDVNGDGKNDFVVGGFAHDAGGTLTSSGIARVHSGADFSVLFEVPGGAANRRLGWAAAGGGDFNNDGRADMIFGAPQRPFNATDNARVLLYLDLP